MTQKTESVREAEQRPTIEDLVFEFARLHATACKVSQQALSDGFMLLVRNVIRLLSEEAEQEADVHANSVGPQSGYQERMAKCRNAKIAAAWLREKAR